jgi:hypothetical protein
VNAVFMAHDIRLTPVNKNACTITPYEKQKRC